MGEHYYHKLLETIRTNTQFAFNNKLGMVDGSIGELAALLYIQKLSKSQEALDLFSDRLSAIIGSPIHNYSLGYGLASLGWLINLIQQENLSTEAIADIDTEEINAILERKLYLMIDARNFDYFKGSLGLLYYLSQIDNEQDYFNRTAKYFVNEIEQCLKERYDFSILRSYAGVRERVINIGTPHGLTGILLILLIIREKRADLCPDNTILNFAEIIISHKFGESKRSFFPAFVHLDGKKESSGIAWCYGDLMIAYALFKTNKLLDRHEYFNLASEILKNIFRRLDFSATELCLCHGLPSLYYIFKGLYNLSQIAECKSTAEKIYQKLEQQFFQKSDKLKDDEEDYLFKKSSLFYGYSATLLTILNKDNPKANWQSCLLL